MFRLIKYLLLGWLLFWCVTAGAEQLNLERLSPMPISPELKTYIQQFNDRFAYSTQKNFEKIAQKINLLLQGVADLPEAASSVSAADTIAVNTGILLVQGSGGAVTMTANPQLEDGFNGQGIVIVGMSDTNTVTFIAGNGLRLASGLNMTLGAGDSLRLRYISLLGDWIEEGRTDV